MSLVEIEGLCKHYPVREGLLRRVTDHVKAVDGVSFQIDEGETLGVVGESGCGKSTLARTLTLLEEPTAGAFTFDGDDVFERDRAEHAYREDIQIVFQDPSGSLTPKRSVFSTLADPIRNFDVAEGDEVVERIERLLVDVGLSEEFMHRYPHELSGGQKQRVGIARALAVDPSFVVLDEPTSALDVSVQADILNLLDDLQTEYGLTYLFISHDFRVVRQVSDRIAVMYLGEIVEQATGTHVFENPRHPYTRALLSSVPRMPGSDRPDPIVLSGDVPSPRDPPSGCSFHPRCSIAHDDCSTNDPPLEPASGTSTGTETETETDHLVACPYSTELDTGEDPPSTGE